MWAEGELPQGGKRDRPGASAPTAVEPTRSVTRRGVDTNENAAPKGRRRAIPWAGCWPTRPTRYRPGRGAERRPGIQGQGKGKGEGEYEHACRSQPDQPQQAAAGRPEPVGEGIHAGVERLQLGGLFVQLALQLGEESALRRACVGIPLEWGPNGYNGVQKGVKLCCKLRAAFLRRHGSPPPFYLQFDYSIPGRKVNRR